MVQQWYVRTCSYTLRSCVNRDEQAARCEWVKCKWNTRFYDQKQICLPEWAKSKHQEKTEKSNGLQVHLHDPQRDITCIQSPPLVQHLNPCRAWPAFPQEPAGHAEYEWPCNWQTKLCVDTAETANGAAARFYWMQMWTFKPHRPCVKRRSVTFHSLGCINATRILAHSSNSRASPAKCSGCGKTKPACDFYTLLF